MSGFLIRGARVVAGDGSPPARLDVRTRDAEIVAVGEALASEAGESLVDAGGRVLMPGFVAAHTHALWAQDRLHALELTLRGVSYPDIARMGGGIFSTVRAVREASEAELVANLTARLRVMLAEGTTSVEVKSGYGLDTENELKMLRVIQRCGEAFPGTVVATALLGHAIDPDEPAFVERTLRETLPAVHAELPRIAIDAYCEQGAWSLADCRRLFERARELGHPLRIHADQFERQGALGLALSLGFRSVDHLERSSASELEQLARSATFGVILPASAFHLDGCYANVRGFLDAGGKLVLASNCNPGSAPTSSMPFVIALAVRHSGVRIDEAITATTKNPALLLGLTDRGVVRAGARADLLLLRHTDERLLAYEFGGNPVSWVMAGGRVVREDA